jgi:maltoporin
MQYFEGDVLKQKTQQKETNTVMYRHNYSKSLGLNARSIKRAAALFITSIAALAAPLIAHADADDDGQFMGYLRVGGGVTQGGGPQNCYYLGNGDGHGYRLGNECDSYAELGYAKTLAKADDGTRFVGHFMVNDYSSNSAYSGNLQISQIYAEATGLTWLNGGTVWAGERYYERPDIHWMDLQYINLNGTGAGFDNIDTPVGGKFSYAVFKDNDTEIFQNPNSTPPSGALTASNSAVRNNLLFRGQPLNPSGNVDVVLGLLTPSTPSSDRHSGYYINLFHHQLVLGGDNTLGIQYGVGPGTGRGAPGQFNPSSPATAFASAGGIGPDAPCCNRIGQSGSTLLGSSDTRLRVFDAVWVQLTNRWSAGFDLLMEQNKSPVYGGNSSNWYSGGFRPEYAFFQHFKLIAEIGMDRVTYPGADAENLVKYTIAPTITLGEGFFDRPELRFFVTRANWNNAATGTINANTGNPNALGLVTENTSVGIQLEAWWGKNWW